MMLVFMVEERSMAELLKIILPRILPDGVVHKIIPHDGKADLRESIPIKLKHWNTSDTKFVIIQDQDSNDCVALKNQIRQVCDRFDKTVLIRIACHEMEAWYFGDLNAVSEAYGKDFTSLATKRKYRRPDAIENPKDELRKLIPEHEQIRGARRIGPHMDVHHNASESFNQFVTGVQRIVHSN